MSYVHPSISAINGEEPGAAKSGRIPSDLPYSVFGVELKKTLKKFGLTNRTVASALQCDPSMVSQYNRGANIPSRKALQTILELVPLHAYRCRLLHWYMVFDKIEPSQGLFPEMHEELLERIDELLEAGCTYQALDLAEELATETLLDEVRSRLEIVTFELRVRLGMYGEAMVHAKKSQTCSESRRLLMQGIALRLRGKPIEAVKALMKSSQMYRPAPGIHTTTRAEEFLLYRQLHLAELDAALEASRPRLAISKIGQIKAHLDSHHPDGGRESNETKELLARFYLTASCPEKAMKIVTDLRGALTESYPSMEERLLILEGRSLAVRQEETRAVKVLRIAYGLCRDRENLHHASVVQSYIGEIGGDFCAA